MWRGVPKKEGMLPLGVLVVSREPSPPALCPFILSAFTVLETCAGHPGGACEPGAPGRGTREGQSWGLGTGEGVSEEGTPVWCPDKHRQPASWAQASTWGPSAVRPAPSRAPVSARCGQLETALPHGRHFPTGRVWWKLRDWARSLDHLVRRSSRPRCLPALPSGAQACLPPPPRQPLGLRWRLDRSPHQPGLRQVLEETATPPRKKQKNNEEKIETTRGESVRKGAKLEVGRRVRASSP